MKQNKKKRSVEPFSVALSLTSPLRLFGCLHYRALTVCCCFFLSLLFTFCRLLGVSLLFCSRHAACRCLALLQFLFWFCPCCGHLLSSLSTSCHYLTLLLYLCITLVSGKQRCHCGSILSAQRIADGRNLCSL